MKVIGRLNSRSNPVSWYTTAWAVPHMRESLINGCLALYPSGEIVGNARGLRAILGGPLVEDMDFPEDDNHVGR